MGAYEIRRERDEQQASTTSTPTARIGQSTKSACASPRSTRLRQGLLASGAVLLAMGCTAREDHASTAPSVDGGGGGIVPGSSDAAALVADTGPSRQVGDEGAGPNDAAGSLASESGLGGGGDGAVGSGGTAKDAGASWSNEANVDAGAPFGSSESGAEAAQRDSEPATEGNVPRELVGIWQETRSSAGDYTNALGEKMTLSSGFSSQLKIAADGSYYFSIFTSGVSSSCATITSLDQSVGTAVLHGGALMLQPTQHRLDVNDCAGPRSLDRGNDPIALTIQLADAWHAYGGQRTYTMTIAGAALPLELTLLHRPPLADPPLLAAPQDFVLGTDPPPAEFQGLWVPASGTDSDFYQPATGQYYFPVLNGSPHHWLRFADEGYETAVALQNVNSEGVCKSDVIYYEAGKAQVQLLESLGGQGDHFVGHVRLEATKAHLIARIRECDEANQVLEYDLKPLMSYYRWIYFGPTAPPESISMGCDFPASEWQSVLCTNATTTFSRRQ